MATNSKYALIKSLRKSAGMQVGPQAMGGGGAGGAGGKIPAGFLAGMNQKKEDEELAMKEEAETSQAQALDDAAKQQDMQIKQIEMEQRIRDQNSQKYQEMQMEQSRLMAEAANLKEQLKHKDTIHKEQLKHNNDLVQQQMKHQQTLNKQLEDHKSQTQSGFSPTLVSRAKSLRATIEKLHKQASLTKEYGLPVGDNTAFLSLAKCAEYVPTTTPPKNGPATPNSMSNSMIKTAPAGVAKTPLSTAPKPTNATPQAPSANPQTPTPQPQPQAPAPTKSPLQYMGDRMGARLTPAFQQLGMAGAMSSMPNYQAQHPYMDAAKSIHSATWDTFKNLRGDLNKGFDDYYKANGTYKPQAGEGVIGGLVGRAGTMLGNGVAKGMQGVLNVPAYAISTAAQGFGHAGEHFKDSWNRGSQANSTWSKGAETDLAERQKGQAALDKTWNDTLANGGDKIDAAWNYWTSKDRGDNVVSRTADAASRAGDWVGDQVGALGSAGKGVLNTATAGLETLWNTGKGAVGAIGSLFGASTTPSTTQSTGWGMNTDAENKAQTQAAEEEKKKILAESDRASGSPGTNPDNYSTSPLVPGLAAGNGMNDAMRLQHTGYAHSDNIINDASHSVDSTTGMIMSPFTPTSGFRHSGGYQPNDMMGAFQNSALDSRPGYRDLTDDADNAFIANRRMLR